MVLHKQWDVAAAKALADGEIDAVAVFIGHDDFKPFLQAKLANRTLEREDAAGLVTNLEANLGRMLDRLAEAKRGKIYVLTLAPWQHVPYVNYQRPTPAEIALLIDTMTQANQRIAMVAKQRGMPLVDISKRFCELVDRHRPLVIEGATVSIHCGGEGGEWFFRRDGMHVGTVASALLVNDLITAVNQYSLRDRHLAIPLFPHPEIADLAGLNRPASLSKKEDSP